MIRISFVALAPIFDALDARATLAMLAADCTPFPPVNNWLIQTKSRTIVSVEIRSNQK